MSLERSPVCLAHVERVVCDMVAGTELGQTRGWVCIDVGWPRRWFMEKGHRREPWFKWWLVVGDHPELAKPFGKPGGLTGLRYEPRTLALTEVGQQCPRLLHHLLDTVFGDRSRLDRTVRRIRERTNSEALPSEKLVWMAGGRVRKVSRGPQSRTPHLIRNPHRSTITHPRRAVNPTTTGTPLRLGAIAVALRAEPVDAVTRSSTTPQNSRLSQPACNPTTRHETTRHGMTNCHEAAPGRTGRHEMTPAGMCGDRHGVEQRPALERLSHGGFRGLIPPSCYPFATRRADCGVRRAWTVVVRMVGACLRRFRREHPRAGDGSRFRNRASVERGSVRRPRWRGLALSTRGSGVRDRVAPRSACLPPGRRAIAGRRQPDAWRPRGSG